MKWFYTRKELVEKCGVSYAQVWRFEKLLSHYLNGIFKKHLENNTYKIVYTKHQYNIIGLGLTLRKVHGLSDNAIKNRVANYVLQQYKTLDGWRGNKHADVLV